MVRVRYRIRFRVRVRVRVSFRVKIHKISGKPWSLLYGMYVDRKFVSQELKVK